MKKPSTLNLLLATLLLITIVGCQNKSNQKNKQDQYDTVKSATKSKIEKPIPGSNCDTMLISQEFSYDVLASEAFNADTNKIKSLFLDRAIIKIEKAVTEEGVPYYPYDFTDGTNKIIVLSNDTSYYIKYAEIKNNKVVLNKKISIGMKKSIFLELLKVKNIKCDTITVKDEELTFESIYIFKNDKLKKVLMGGIVD